MRDMTKAAAYRVMGKYILSKHGLEIRFHGGSLCIVDMIGMFLIFGLKTLKRPKWGWAGNDAFCGG